MGEETRGVEALTGYGRIYLDSMVFIYHLEASPEYSRLTASILRLVESGAVQGVTSALTLMEVMVRPMSLGREGVARQYEYLLSSFPNLKVRPLDREVAVNAAEVRAKHGMRTPDAIHVGTARAEEAEAFITNDARLTRLSELNVLMLKRLSDGAPSGI